MRAKVILECLGYQVTASPNKWEVRNPEGQYVAGGCRLKDFRHYANKQLEYAGGLSVREMAQAIEYKWKKE